MDEELASGIERAVFGAVGRDDIDAWLSRHLRARLGGDLSHIVFGSGRIAAVYGAALSDGRQVAVKVHRGVADLTDLSAAGACQRRLAEVGYPCPEPLDGPASTEGLTAVVETLCSDGEPGNSHEPNTRRAMAHALFEQLELLRGAPVDGLVVGAAAWSHYEHGPWPQPHDPIFDFTTTPPAFTWLADLARRAASVLNHAGPPDAVAHADWTCGNLRFHDGRVSCSYDWDSLAAAPEPVLVGLAAGCSPRAAAPVPPHRPPWRSPDSSATTSRSAPVPSAKPNNELPQPPSPAFWPTTHLANSACCLLAQVRSRVVAARPHDPPRRLPEPPLVTWALRHRRRRWIEPGPRRAWSTFGHTRHRNERYATVYSGTSFALVPSWDSARTGPVAES